MTYGAFYYLSILSCIYVYAVGSGAAQWMPPKYNSILFFLIEGTRPPCCSELAQNVNLISTSDNYTKYTESGDMPNFITRDEQAIYCLSPQGEDNKLLSSSRVIKFGISPDEFVYLVFILDCSKLTFIEH